MDAVVHLAGIRRSPDREAFFKVNAEGTRALCEALAAQGGRRRFVLCGSLAATGPSDDPRRPKCEEDPFAPTEWYGESKAEAERIAFSFNDRLDITVARPPRLIGPGDKENLAFFKVVKRGLKLVITGGPRPVTMLDVDDCVDLMLLLLDKKEAVGEPFFAAGPETHLEQLEDCIAQTLGVNPRTLKLSPRLFHALATMADGVSVVTGKHLPLNRKLARQLTAPAWTCSGEKARRLLGWQPRRGLAESIRRSAEWYLKEGWL
jgi:dihydroflavonol-4-reductase